MASAINIALPSIGREFTLDAIALGWVATSYLLATAVFLVPFGKIADTYGRKRVFVYGVAVYSLSSLLSALSFSPSLLIFSRVVQGLGGAMIFGTSVAILTAAYPEKERGRVLGVNVAAVYTGLSAGPFLGGFLTQGLGWRSIFAIAFLLGCATLLWSSRRLAADDTGRGRVPFDWPGSFLYAVALVAIMHGLPRLPSIPGWSAVAAGVGALWGFNIRESRAGDPILNMALFRRNTVFAFSNLAALINYSATSAVGFLVSLYLQSVRDLTPQQTGLVLVSQPLVMAVFSPLAGRLSDRIEPRIVASLGMGLTIPCLLLLAGAGAGSPVLLLVLILSVLGLGFALFSSPNTNAIMSSVDRRTYGVAASTLATMRLTGQMLSMGIAMLILSVNMGPARITPDNYPAFLASLRIAFVVFAILCAGGVFASLARGRMRQGSART
jgi:MFS family permease